MFSRPLQRIPVSLLSPCACEPYSCFTPFSLLGGDWKDVKRVPYQVNIDTCVAGSDSLCRIYIVVDFAIQLAVYRIRVQNPSKVHPAVNVTAQLQNPLEECPAVNVMHHAKC
jgi:hypothetical protein